MPLRDHFHRARFPESAWEGIHSRWAVAMAVALNHTLPRRYVAIAHFHAGSAIEADVAEYDRGFSPDDVQVNGSAGGVSVQPWAPPTPPLVLDGSVSEEYEIELRDIENSHQLLAAIELVSPANKDRPGTRRTFAAKCAGYLGAGVGLVVLDIVTNKSFNLHDELADVLSWGGAAHMPDGTVTYAVSYRPARRDDANRVDCWPQVLAVGREMPVVPLYLRATTTVPLDLEATYMEARRALRLD